MYPKPIKESDMINKIVKKSPVIIFLAVYLAACSKTGAPINLPTDTSHSGELTVLIPTTAVGEDQSSEDSVKDPSSSLFTLASPVVVEGGRLPVEYTCDGVSSTLALSWGGAPAGTQSFAVIMHHVASPDDFHWYWIVYDIPANVTNLAKNSAGVGTVGNNSVNGKTAYSPPCSKGPGEKVYTYTAYALSAQPQFSVPASQVNREVLLAAIQNITLASAELRVTYTRK
jgi:phosphatidylethanolamine-binding protein (PEBP) family uncharacterized protein